jgi:ectoine hydroxylase-related dioxygenase (phytanoyl-CoA dioxygenase family)
MKDLTFFAIREFAEASTDIEKHVEQLHLDGYTILENVLDEKDLAIARLKIDKIYKRQIDEVGDEHLLEKIKDSNLARCLLAYDEFFLSKVAANKRVIQIINNALGEFYTLMLQNAIINKPYPEHYSSNACAFHRDLNYQHFTSSRPLSISALFCIDDFTKKTGGTCVLPYTHKSEKCPSEYYIQKNEKVVNAKAGSVIIFDSMMYHRAGRNTSDNVRRAINNMYVLPFIKQQISLPTFLKGKYAENPFYKQLLGYDCEPEKDVISFRRKRLMKVP